MKVYLDHNATTPIHPEVLIAMMPFLGGQFGNASSRHRFGDKPRAAVEEAAGRIAAAIGAEPEEVVFVSGGTEADNLAVQGVVRTASPGRRHVVTAAVEHPAVLAPCRFLEETEGVAVTVLPVDGGGRVDPEAVREALCDDTVLVSIQTANNEVGTIQPVAEIGALCRERSVLFHTDAVQALGKIPVNVSDLGADLVSLSAHKVYGPKGAGALYVRKGVPLAPLVFGGGRAAGFRAGTDNVPGIVGFGKAVEVAEAGRETSAPVIAALRDRLEGALLGGIEGVRRNGHEGERLPNTSNLGFAGVEGDALLLALDDRGIAVSAGAACHAGSGEPSGVLRAMGVGPEAGGSIRFSLGFENTEPEMDAVASCVKDCVGALRRDASPSG
jgi:cysteine desulfurase